MYWFSAAVHWRRMGSASPLGARTLAMEQFRFLRKQMPILFLVIVVDSVSIAQALPASIAINLSLLLILLASMLNANRRDLVKLAAWRAKIQAERQRARVAEARFDTAINNMSQGLCFFDGTQRLIVCNRRYTDMYGLPPEHVKPGTTLREIVDLRFRAGSFPAMTTDEYLAWRDRIAVVDKPSDTIVELKDGRIFEIHHRPMPDRGWVATHEDVTGRYHAEKALAAAKAAAEHAEREARMAHTRLVDALDVIPEGLVVFDSEDRYVLWNRRYAEIYSESRDMLVAGARFEDTLRAGLARGQYPEAIGREEDWLRERMALHARPQHTHEQQLPGDRWLRIEERRTADGGGIGLRVDITDLKRSEASFRLLFDENPLPMWVLDVDTLELLAVNAATCRRYGYTREELLTKTIETLRIPEERDMLRQEVRHSKGVQSAERTRRHITADGTLFDVAIEARPLRYDGRNASVAVAFDMTERIRAEGELRQTREFLDTVIENVPVSIFVKSARERRYVLTNAAAERFLGVSRKELLGKTTGEFFARAMAEKVEQEDRELLETGSHQIRNGHEMDTAGHGTRIVNSTRLLIRDQRGIPQYIMRVVEDVTERTRAEQRIAHMARHDSLTDLPNRAAFDEHFHSLLDRARLSNKDFAVLCIDLDRFKEINDLFGHATGDAVLREASMRLQSTSPGAFLARIGGDEFVILTSVGVNDADIRALADRLRLSFIDDIMADGRALHLGLSIGIAVFPDDGCDATSLMGNADAALYRAKKEGRGATRFFTAAMDQQLRERRALQHDLRSAIESGELSLAYQPQSHIDGTVFGFEALARWRHPRRGAVPPAEFIPVAEDSGLIVELGAWVLREACREAASWVRPLQVAVNISAIQFRRDSLHDLVHSILLETGLAPHRLELEITEGVLVENVSRAAFMLRGLKALGVRIALDDFGTGYSSLSYLQSFPLDRIKIDGTFVANLETKGSLAIVRAVVGLAHGLGLPVLAEGVESNAQVAILASESCDDVQGYLLGRPCPISEYAGVIGRSARRSRPAVAAG
jgi:diguanylate cyclase (GGDEF)-like protein/PAS domain S-box-containing protein